jgi:Helix-turn-helix domain
MAAFSQEVQLSLEHSPERCALFDPDETAAYLRVAKQTLAKWRCGGTGPRFVRIGGRIFYDVADLETFIADRKFGSTAEADQAAVA